jgi:hypothetical protein
MSSRVGPLVVGGIVVRLAWVIKRHGPEIREPAFQLLSIHRGDQRGAERVLFPGGGAVDQLARVWLFVQLHFLISLFWEATLGVPYQWWAIGRRR